VDFCQELPHQHAGTTTENSVSQTDDDPDMNVPASTARCSHAPRSRRPLLHWITNANSTDTPIVQSAMISGISGTSRCGTACGVSEDYVVEKCIFLLLFFCFCFSLRMFTMQAVVIFVPDGADGVPNALAGFW
jgi:hypothetical protein